MSQFKRYLNIINELKVPEMGLKSAKQNKQNINILKCLNLDTDEIENEPHKTVFNYIKKYINDNKEIPEWEELQKYDGAPPLDNNNVIKLDKLSSKFFEDNIFKMIKASALDYANSRANYFKDSKENTVAAIEKVDFEKYKSTRFVFKKIIDKAVEKKK